MISINNEPIKYNEIIVEKSFIPNHELSYSINQPKYLLDFEYINNIDKSVIEKLSYIAFNYF
jgi:hypothetical protein